MKCPSCQRENEQARSYCIFCGSPLPSPVELQKELRHLRELVTQVNERLATLESMQGIPTSTPEPTTAPQTAVTEGLGVTPTLEPMPVTPAPAPTRPEIAQAVSRRESLVSEELPLPPKKRPPVKAKEQEWEWILGGNWLARVGVLALTIGVGFFLKYAFDKEWLGPAGRVILGISAGLALLGGGHYWRNRYPIFAQTLSGGGIALLYLSIFAAFAMFNLINFYLAIGLLLAISVTSAVIALRYNSMALAILGIIGAFIAPFILAVSGSGALGAADPVQATQSFWLLVYVIVVDLGVLWLSTYRNWRWFTLLALIGSIAVYGVWYGQFGDEVSLLTSMGSLTIIFLIFVGATTLYHIVWRRASEEFDYALMVINAVSYFGISYGLLWADFREWLGGFSILLALFYGGLTYISIKRGAENDRLSLFALGISLVFLTVAIPVQLGGQVWTTIAWAAQGTVLIWLSFRLRMPLLRVFSYAVFSVMALRLMFFDTWMNLNTTPVLNERFLAFLVSIVALYFAGYLSWRERNSLQVWEKNAWSVFPVFLVAANFFSLWVIGAEVISYNNSALTPQEGWPLIFLIILAGAMTLHYTAWRRHTQDFDWIVLLINAAFYFLISYNFLWADFREWMGGLYLLLALFHGVMAYVAIKRSTAENDMLGPIALGISLLFFTVAIIVQLENTVWVSIAWAVEAAVLIWLSVRLRMSLLHYYSYAVFSIVALRLLFFDTKVDLNTFTPVLNERFLAFLAVIAALYFAGWWERKSLKQRDIDWSYYSILFVAANFFSLWLLSAEVIDYFNSQLAITPADSALQSARNLSLTALWAFYAVILLVVGIIRKWRMVRLYALALLTIPIVKVFVYDVFALEQVYRIIAFVGLGVLLLISGYLYQRYSKAIKGFFVEK